VRIEPTLRRSRTGGSDRQQLPLPYRAARPPIAAVKGTLAALLAAVAVAVPVAASASPPAGASAVCRDGTYSYSQHHSGTCSHHGGVAKWLDTGPTTGATTSARAGSATSTAAGLGSTVRLAARARTLGCRLGVEPDRRCSPGAYYSGLTGNVICSPSFRTSAIRNVPQSEKFQVEREYGTPARYYGRSIEIDHIVPLELGGSNDITNLYPEPGSGDASYHVKDKLENNLHDLVCSGAMALRTAQRQIAANWEALYTRVFRMAP
jgi:Protein of unknown function (DUF3761)